MHKQAYILIMLLTKGLFQFSVNRVIGMCTYNLFLVIEQTGRITISQCLYNIEQSNHLIFSIWLI